ncbi:WD40 repeat domain-containing protein [Enhygromyxa salina]|uniref:WD40 repeat domain-containing protein n=1 Tax=Enhygromyxa salina TaxID=215803 RepID=UPI0011BAA0FC|nr:WD40 repeat domain-containing protein [Enhygromyxa salina]
MRALPLLTLTLSIGCGRATGCAVPRSNPQPEFILKGHEAGLTGGKLDSRGGVVVTYASDGAAQRWSLETGERLGPPVLLLPFAESVDISTQGEVAVLGEDDAVVLWKPTGGPNSEVVASDATTASFADGPPWLLVGGRDGAVRIWSVNEGALLNELDGHENEVWTVCSDADGKTIAAAGNHESGSLWDLQTGSRKSLEGHSKLIMDIALSPDGSRALTVSWDETAILWDAHTGDAIKTLVGHSGPLWTGKISPDGSKAITAGDDGSIRIWNTTNGDLVSKTINAHDNTIDIIEFSPDGSLFVTGGWDHVARTWKLSTGESLATLGIHSKRITDVSFDESGRYILTTSIDKTAAVWTMANAGPP